MIKPLKNPFALFLFSILTFALSCSTEDPGPLQEISQDFSVTDFDRLEIGEAFHVQVEQGNSFSIHVQGDKRNIDDLDLYKRGSTLIIRFDNNANREHYTTIIITMPNLKAANFSGATESTITGFESDEEFDLILSGASTSQLEAGYREVNLVLSGASTLVMKGLGDELHANLSGASLLQAFDFPVRQANVVATGASHGKLMVSDELAAIASGASSVLYRGNPSVSSDASGGSTIHQD